MGGCQRGATGTANIGPYAEQVMDHAPLKISSTPPSSRMTRERGNEAPQTGSSSAGGGDNTRTMPY